MKLTKMLGIAFLALLALSACTDPSLANTTVSFRLTDAPIDAATISHVYVQFGGLSINESGSASDSAAGWTDIALDPAKRYDLLSLTGGVADLLGNVVLRGGTQINQIRFTGAVVTVVDTADPGTEKSCTLSSTSLKIVNSFAVPLTGTLSLTVDFDVGKSLVYTAGSGYKMKPVLRAVVDNEAGKIKGALVPPAADTSPFDGYIVYAYAAGTYNTAELTPTADGIMFANSYTSAIATDDGTGSLAYTLAFLEAGTYDLVVYDSSTGAVVDSTTYLGVAVQSGKDTVENITL